MLVVRALLLVVFILSGIVCIKTVVLRRVVAQDVLGTSLQRMQLADRRGIVGLESMLGGVLLAVVMQISQTFQIISPIGIIAFVYFIFRVGIRRLRTGVYLVGECQHAVLHLEQTLVVDTSIDGIPGRLAAVESRIAINGSGVYVLRKGGDVVRRAVALVSATPKSERHSDQAQCIYFVAGLHAARLEGTVALVTAVIVQIGRILRNSFRRHMLAAAAVVAGLVIIIVVVAGADSQLAALYRTECSTACTAVADVGTERSRIAFESATHGDNVQNTAHTFSIILGAGIGNHLDMLNAVGRHTLQYLGRVIAHHVVGLSVDVHLEAAAPVHLNIVLAVHRHQRYLAEHLQHRVRLGIRVILHIIFYLVDVRLYQRLLSYNFHLSQLIGSIHDVECAEVHQLLPCLHRKVLHDGSTSHGSDGHHEVARTGYFLLELAFHVRYQHFQRLCRGLFLHDFNGSIRFTFLGERVEQNSFNLERSVCRVLRCNQSRNHQHP